MNATLPPPPYAVIGLGRLGTALSRALSRTFPENSVLAVEPDPRLRAKALLDRLVSDAQEAPTPALGKCGLIFLCVPLGELEATLQSLAPHLGEKVILTDTTTVKGAVREIVDRVLPNVTFVGGHPMVGADGSDAGERADLFAGRRVILCPREGEEEAAARVGAVWAAMGARPVVLSDRDHDRLVAATTHAPYLAALALARMAGSLEEAERVVGKAFVDASRLATLAPEVVAASVAANPFAAAAARVLADELRRLADLAESSPEELSAAAAEARAHRERLVPEGA